MRHILHADFDAFYTSVEQLDNPRIRRKPVVVGGSPQSRGVVASASYEARQFGIRSAMPMRTALRLCPQLIRIPARFPRYRQVSQQVMTIFRSITPLVEPLSLDEAYLDVTHAVAQGTPPQTIAAALKHQVQSQLGLTISIGVATSKSIAKIASDMDKPDGLTVIPPGKETQFLAPLPVNKLWGVGPKTAQRLIAEGINTIGDIAARQEHWLQTRFGKHHGTHMRQLALGNDHSSVITERPTKSISAETTLPQDTADPELLHEIVNRLSQQVALQLRNKQLHGRTIKLKLRLSDFTTFTRQRTLTDPIQSPYDLSQSAAQLLQTELQPNRRFRLIGVGVSSLEHQIPQTTPEEHQLPLTGFN